MSDAVTALAEALHDNDDLCAANYVMPFSECEMREWDIKHAAEVLDSLRRLGWRVTHDPAGTIPLGFVDAMSDGVVA